MCKIFTKEKIKGNLHKIVTFELGGGQSYIKNLAKNC